MENAFCQKSRRNFGPGTRDQRPTTLIVDAGLLKYRQDMREEKTFYQTEIDISGYQLKYKCKLFLSSSSCQ